MILLPWPSSVLTGHNKGAWWEKSDHVKIHRSWAIIATMEARPVVDVEGKGDILVTATFYPKDRRIDRVNMPILLKPYWDGIADALGVNDSRFLPSYHFREPNKANPRVIITIEGEASHSNYPAIIAGPFATG